LPSAVFGPVESCALARLALVCSGVDIGCLLGRWDWWSCSGWVASGARGRGGGGYVVDSVGLSIFLIFEMG
jgi:hypothetical protein